MEQENGWQKICHHIWCFSCIKWDTLLSRVLGPGSKVQGEGNHGRQEYSSWVCVSEKAVKACMSGGNLETCCRFEEQSITYLNQEPFTHYIICKFTYSFNQYCLKAWLNHCLQNTCCCVNIKELWQNCKTNVIKPSLTFGLILDNGMYIIVQLKDPVAFLQMSLKPNYLSL